jgi:4-hydroxy-tetrahydrodipicolinate reductase
MDPPALIRVCVAGITGWTGGAIAKAIRNAEDLELVAGVSRSDPDSYPSVGEALDAVRADVLVDFTHASAVKANVFSALGRGVNVVIGSSGLSASDYDSIDATARDRGVGVISAGNFSLTAAILLRAATEAARHLEAGRFSISRARASPTRRAGRRRSLRSGWEMCAFRPSACLSPGRCSRSVQSSGAPA